MHCDLTQLPAYMDPTVRKTRSLHRKTQLISPSMDNFTAGMFIDKSHRYEGVKKKRLPKRPAVESAPSAGPRKKRGRKPKK